MPTKEKKAARQYPMFAVRLSEEQKTHVNDTLDKRRNRLNSRLKLTEQRWFKNDIIYAAIALGLPLVNGKLKA